MTTKDIMELTIPQLEYILDGCKKNNDDIEKQTKNENTYEGADAIQYLIDSGEIGA